MKNAFPLPQKKLSSFPNTSRASIKGARASRVMPKPLRLAGKHVVKAMRLSLLKKTVVLSQNIRAHQLMAHAPARDAEAAPTRGKICRKSNAAFFARKTGRLFPKTSRAHQSGAHAPVRDAEAAPTRGKTCRKSNAAFFALKTVVLSQNIARTSISGARASRVKPKPLRLAGKYVVKAMRLPDVIVKMDDVVLLIAKLFVA